MDPAATTVATSLASSEVAGEAASVVATARSVEHGDGRSGREKNDDACLEPMMMNVPYDSCMPNWRVCGRHAYCAMMQVFSLKLANTSYVGEPIELYGYVAVRDLLNPMRNYVFNRTRDDPFIVGHDGLIQMSGPKRGIRMQATVVIEFYLKIKTGGEEGGDLELIDGVAQFSDRCNSHASVITRRLDGSYTSPSYVARGKIQLFDGVIAAETSELSRVVVAVAQDAKLVVTLELSQKGGQDMYQCDVFRVEKHGTSQLKIQNI
uniref:DUF6598 domain-containing protein n=1 Tax=Aegilops tauschii TaxID=37682 RepID=M8BU56_AEGTA